MTTTLLEDVERNREALLAYLERHDPDRLADDAVFVDVTSGLRWQGPEAIAGMLSWFYRSVFDATLEDTRTFMAADGRQAVLEGTFVGRHIGEFAGVPATGRTVRVPLVVLYDLADGRITGARFHFNVASFLGQVGASH